MGQFSVEKPVLPGSTLSGNQHAVQIRNTRWCSDGLEIGCDNGEKVRVAFALDCCDWEAMGYVATTAGITAEDVRDLMVASVEHRFGQVNKLPHAIEWLTDNGQLLHRPRHPPLRPRHWPHTAHDAGRKPAEQWHGRGVCPNVEARLRPRQPTTERPNGHRPIAQLA